MEASTYVESLHKTGQDLSAAICKAYPTRVQPYGRVTVLFFKWENDNLGVEESELRLEDVFENVYGFTALRCTIPARSTFRAEVAVSTALEDLLNVHDQADALLIVVYCGHADGGLSQCVWK